VSVGARVNCLLGVIPNKQLFQTSENLLELAKCAPVVSTTRNHRHLTACAASTMPAVNHLWAYVSAQVQAGALASSDTEVAAVVKRARADSITSSSSIPAPSGGSPNTQATSPFPVACLQLLEDEDKAELTSVLSDEMYSPVATQLPTRAPHKRDPFMPTRASGLPVATQLTTSPQDAVRPASTPVLVSSVGAPVLPSLLASIRTSNRVAPEQDPPAFPSPAARTPLSHNRGSPCSLDAVNSQQNSTHTPTPPALMLELPTQAWPVQVHDSVIPYAINQNTQTHVPPSSSTRSRGLLTSSNPDSDFKPLKRVAHAVPSSRHVSFHAAPDAPQPLQQSRCPPAAHDESRPSPQLSTQFQLLDADPSDGIMATSRQPPERVGARPLGTRFGGPGDGLPGAPHPTEEAHRSSTRVSFRLGSEACGLSHVADSLACLDCLATPCPRKSTVHLDIPPTNSEVRN
jgi:hypothetical protein